MNERVAAYVPKRGVESLKRKLADNARGTLAQPEWDEVREVMRALQHQESRADVLGFAVAHVLRYGKLGKQSKARLSAAMKAVGWNRGS